MNIFSRVALKTLMKNKTRTAVTVIGIILSAAMICSVTTFASSIYNYALKNAVYTYGDWHCSALNGNKEIYDKIDSSNKVKKAVWARQIGYAVAEDCRNEDKPYIYILGTSDGFEEMMSIHITSGRYPTLPNEIMLPAHLAENGGVIYRLGDTLTLEVGQRISDGYTMWQHNPYCYETTDGKLTPLEELITDKTLSYTVVGFYERPAFEPYTAPGYTAITLAESTDESSPYSVWCKMKNPRDAYDFALNDIYGFSAAASSLNTDTNESVLNYSGATGYDSMDLTITAMAAIIIGLIMFGSVSLIYNAFSISVSERTRQFGLLSSVGATRKQLRKMVLFEAFAVGVVGIPIGVLAGIGGIGVTLLIIGHKFETLFDYPIPLRVSVSASSVIIAAIVSFITVLISAWIPSKRATRVSAVEAIRQSRDITASGRELKSSKLVYRLFGLPGMLANKHYKRSKRKYRATVISLFMSIVLFVSASAFTNYLTEAYEGLTPSSYDIVYNHVPYEDSISSEELLEEFRNDDAVTGVACVVNNYENIEVDKAFLSDDAFSERFGLIRGEKEDTAYLFGRIMFVDRASYEKLVKDNNLSREYLETETPEAIVIGSFRYFDVETEKYELIDLLNKENINTTVSAPKIVEGYDYSGTASENGEEWVFYTKEDGSGEELQIPSSEALVTVSLSLGDSVADSPFYAETGGLKLIYPISAKEHIFPEDWQGSIDSKFETDFYFTSSDHKKSFEAIKATVSENGMPSNWVWDYAADDEEKDNIVIIIRVFSYGFIALISLIAAANVFNTISTNISLRRREFAMLKSVGMTAGGFNKMMNFECLLYGAKALLYGLPASAAVTYLIHLAVNESFRTGFRLPVTAILIAVFSVFAVVFVTMMYSMSKIKKENPIDALKNENL